MSSSREQLRLHDIVGNIDAIFVYLEGRSYEAYAADRLVVDATERCLERMAEAVVKIGSDRLREIAPAVPFERVRGLGNLLRHAYDEIDQRQIYILIKRDLPILRTAAVEAIDRG